MAEEYVERACEAARMGVSTAVIVGNRATREGVVGEIHVLAKDAEFVSGGSVALWIFGDGELFVASSLLAARSAYLRRHPHGPALETVYPKDGNL